MKLLRSSESKITKNENGENVSHLEVTYIVLVHCNIVNSDYQQFLRVLYIFTPNKSLGHLLAILPEMFRFWKTSNSEFSYIQVWFTDQNSKPSELEDKIIITLVINWCSKCKKRHAIQFNQEIEYL